MSNGLFTIKDLQKLAKRIQLSDKGKYVDSNEDLHVVMVNIAKDLKREADRLVECKHDLSIVGMCVRNIFELFLISIHVKSSDVFLKDWIHQSHKDMTDIQHGLSSLLKRSGIESSKLDNSIVEIEKSAAKHGIVPRHNFNMKVLAKNHGYQEDYDGIHKLCSKVIHPSSIKINAYDAMNIEGRFHVSLVHVATYFLALFIEDRVNA